MSVGIEPYSPPAAGSTATGDLYVDLQSRQIWIGVDVAVDPAGSVLLSDIMAIQPAINTSLASAKTYTDQQILTRAPTSHTHTSSQITDFTPAVQAIVSSGAGGFQTGMIVMYSGSLANIGVTPLNGWHLCDGTQGTPDLRDRFVLGAGNQPIGQLNTLTKATTDTVAAHKHNIQYHVLTQTEMPVHSHTVSASGSGSGSGSTAAAGDHTHTLAMWAGDGGRFDGLGGNGVASFVGNLATGTAGNHTHNVSVSVTVSVSGNTDARGSGAGHNHDEDLAGSHSHDIAQANLREAIPYYALAFIMKL